MIVELFVLMCVFVLFLKQPKCVFDGNCKIDANTRRFCPHCRLKKCFDVGMNRDLILGIYSVCVLKCSRIKCRVLQIQ